METRPGKRIGCLALALLAIAGCGGTSHAGSTSNQTGTASTSPVEQARLHRLSDRTLRNGELTGLTSSGQTSATDAAKWVVEDDVPESLRSAETARLVRLGFVGGIRDELAQAGGHAEGLSLVLEFSSPAAAISNLAFETSSRSGIPPPNKHFTVPGIPGARGFEYTSADEYGTNVAFVKGPYDYLVGESAVRSPRQAVIEAAQKLDARVGA